MTLLGETGISKAKTIMVGDSSVDIRTARNAGVQACGCLWDFQPETFVAEPPDFQIEHLGNLWTGLRAINDRIGSCVSIAAGGYDF